VKKSSILSACLVAAALLEEGCSTATCEPKNEGDLEALAAEESVGCLIQIKKTALEDLAALSGLQEARAGVSIADNDQLANIQDLETARISRSLAVWNNPKLENAKFSFHGSVADLSFRGADLEEIDLDVDGDVEAVVITSAPHLTGLTLHGLAELASITVNDAALTDLSGLADLRIVSNRVEFRNVEGLARADVEAFVDALSAAPDEVTMCGLDDGDAC
jgi:hypothetical protein